MPDHEVFGRGLNYIPVTSEAIGYQKCVAGPERPHRSVVADQAHMTHNDATEFVTFSEGPPCSGRAGPCASDQVARRIGEEDRAFVVGVSFQYAIGQVAQAASLRFAGVLLEGDYLWWCGHAGCLPSGLQIFSSRSQYHL